MKPRTAIKSRTNTRDVSAEIMKMQHALWAERTVGSSLHVTQPLTPYADGQPFLLSYDPPTFLGHSMPDFEARRTRQGSILKITG